ncbi:MAG: hypothetical protein ABSC48_16275 [Terracidiphilus sp.]|jgi:hypothetical protein
MSRWFKIAFAALIACSWPPSSSAQCGFHIAPAADVKWYRDAGWQTPGTADAKSISKVNLTVNGKPFVWPDGITVSMVVHEDGYSVSFPEAIFDDQGTRKKMGTSVFQLKQLLRWEMNGKIYAYSYELWPYDIACSSTVDIIDDKGDGKFRLMISMGHTFMGLHPAPPPVPEWLREPKS